VSPDVDPSTVNIDSRYDGTRPGWTSSSRGRHVALIDTIRGKASRPRRTAGKPTEAAGAAAAGEFQPAAGATSTSDKRVWAKLIARLSRKMGASRLSTRSGVQQLPDVDLHPGTGVGGGGAIIRGTSSVLPVTRNPLTKTLAYNDNAKPPIQNNNNVPSNDFASRVCSMHIHDLVGSIT